MSQMWFSYILTISSFKSPLNRKSVQYRMAFLLYLQKYLTLFITVYWWALFVLVPLMIHLCTQEMTHMSAYAEPGLQGDI